MSEDFEIKNKVANSGLVNFDISDLVPKGKRLGIDIKDFLWEGMILRGAAGEGGFGYDPLFLVPEYGCSAAELPAGVKNHLSHRALALAQLLAALGIAC